MEGVRDISHDENRKVFFIDGRLLVLQSNEALGVLEFEDVRFSSVLERAHRFAQTEVS